MKIECILKRPGGTHVDLDDTHYHFKPEAKTGDAHVADVTIKAHIGRFLSIAEGYEVYGSDEPKQEVLLSSSVHPDTFEFGGVTHQLGDIVMAAHVKSGLSIGDWNSLSEDERHDLIDAQLDTMEEQSKPVGDAATGGLPALDPADTNADGIVDDTEERTAAAAAYKDKFGKLPHGKWTAERIREELAK